MILLIFQLIMIGQIKAEDRRDFKCKYFTSFEEDQEDQPSGFGTFKNFSFTTDSNMENPSSITVYTKHMILTKKIMGNISRKPEVNKLLGYKSTHTLQWNLNLKDNPEFRLTIIKHIRWKSGKIHGKAVGLGRFQREHDFLFTCKIKTAKN